MKEKYQTEVVPALMERFGYRNIMAVPHFEKISSYITVGESTQDPKPPKEPGPTLVDLFSCDALITPRLQTHAALQLRSRIAIQATAA